MGGERVRPRAVIQRYPGFNPNKATHKETMDFHTHNLLAPAGKAIINLPEEALRFPAAFALREGALYSAGVHPWWTDSQARAEADLKGVRQWLSHPQVVAIGECGIDRMQGGEPDVQEMVLRKQLAWAEEARLPVTLHIVRAFDMLLRLHKELRPRVKWTVHGFRGKPALAKQLLDAGLDLSFGLHYNENSFRLTPPERRLHETDENGKSPAP